MSASTSSAPSVRGGTRYQVRRAINGAGITLSLLCLAVALIPLGAILVYVLAQGGTSLNLAFFTQLPHPAGESGGGMQNALFGTLEIMVLTSLIGLPVGLLSGIYLARAGGGRFANVVRFVTDVIAGTPSIVAGVVAYALVVVPLGGFSALSGSVALALLMFPTVTRATEEAIKLVPITVREAALALGLPEWKGMFRVILPTAASGIVTAIMLGIARVAGETAPLLFTAFGDPNVQLNPLHSMETLPAQIWTYAISPYDTWHQEAWAGAFVLFVLIVILNLLARLLTGRLRARVGAS